MNSEQMSRFMRMMIFFDLPVKSKQEQRTAAQFRNFLLKDGYYMVQYSVYARICSGYDAVETHRKRLSEHLPDNGSIRLLVITEKQYESIDILLGNYKVEDTPVEYEQITFL